MKRQMKTMQTCFIVLSMSCLLCTCHSKITIRALSINAVFLKFDCWCFQKLYDRWLIFAKCFWNPDPTILTQLLKHSPRNMNWRKTTPMHPLILQDMSHPSIHLKCINRLNYETFCLTQRVKNQFQIYMYIFENGRDF